MNVEKKINTLYFTVETGSRELHSKILLALGAAARGYRAFIGPKSIVGLAGKTLPCGVVLFKDCLGVRTKTFEMLVENGNRVCVHDEEGFVYHSDDDYLARRVSAGSLQYVDTFFCWGGRQKKILEEFSEKNIVESSFCVAGHPRIDLMRDPLASYVEKINNSSVSESSSSGCHDKSAIILVNTKFSEANHRDGRGGWMAMLEKYDQVGPRGKGYRNEQIRYKENLLGHYLRLVDALSSSFPHYLIVVRPHPSESEQTYKEYFSNKNNVHVTKEHPVGYWISRASYCIHTACTTGIESALAGVPTINFTPIDGGDFDSKLPGKVSDTICTQTEVLNAIKNDCLSAPSVDRFRSIQDRLFVPERLSYNLIVDSMVDLARGAEITPAKFCPEKMHDFKLWRMISTQKSPKALNLAKSIFRYAVRRVQRQNLEYSYNYGKLSISKGEVQMIASAFVDILPGLSDIVIDEYPGGIYSFRLPGPRGNGNPPEK